MFGRIDHTVFLQQLKCALLSKVSPDFTENIHNDFTLYQFTKHTVDHRDGKRSVEIETGSVRLLVS